MAELLFWIEASAPILALKSSFVVYPLVSAAHIAGVGILFTSILLMDLALLRIWRGIEPAMAVTRLRPVALAGFTAALATGLALFAVRASDYAGNPAFLVKLALILAAGLNFALTSRRQAGKAAAAASLLLWSAALVAGRFIGFL